MDRIAGGADLWSRKFRGPGTEREIQLVQSTLFRPPVETLRDSETQWLPEPVRRYFDAALEPGRPLIQTVRIAMSGAIRVRRWLPFRAVEVLTPHVGFIWSARAAGVISGSDRYVDGEGSMSWRLAGLLPVLRASGPDVSRSAAERGAGEAVWVPTSLLPHFGVTWEARAGRAIVAHFDIDGHDVVLRLTVNEDGTVRSIVMPRWGDPDGTGTFGLHSFGGDFTEHATFEGLTIPSAGSLGWHYGTERWPDGEFFRFRIDDLRPLTA